MSKIRLFAVIGPDGKMLLGEVGGDTWPLERVCVATNERAADAFAIQAGALDFCGGATTSFSRAALEAHGYRCAEVVIVEASKLRDDIKKYTDPLTDKQRDDVCRYCLAYGLDVLAIDAAIRKVRADG